MQPPDTPPGTAPEIHAETGAAWDHAAAIYERDEAADVAFLRAGGVSLLPPELPYLRDLTRWCGRAIHLQCAGGKDTLSLWNLGAGEVVGVDISARMIASARRRSDALGAPATWLRADVLKTPQELDGTADLVYTGKGALPWVMDLAVWAGTVSRLLRPGGLLYLFDGHPLDWVWDESASDYGLHPEYGDYFSPVHRADRWPAPLLPDGEGAPRAREHQWTLGEIVSALADAGLRLRRLEEHPVLYWDQFPELRPELAPRLPHSFSLLMVSER
jgi:SAM-dependent methyltransferase